MNKNFYCVTLGVILCSMLFLASCSNDINSPNNGNEGIGNLNPVLNPDLVTWSGNQTFFDSFHGNTYATRNENASFEWWQGDRDWKKPHDIIESEKDYVLTYLKENPNGGCKSVDIDTYILQVVGGRHNDYYGGRDHNNAEQWVRDATSKMNYCCIDGFFTQINNNGMNSETPILIQNVPATNASYHDSNANLTQVNLYSFYFITFPNEDQYGYMAGKTGLYLCFDYATYKSGESWGVTADGVYDDWVIKLSPSDGTFFQEPDDKNCECGEDCTCGEDCQCEDETCNCPDCGDDSGNNSGDTPGTPGTPGTPDTPGNKNYDKEVEINLSLNDVHKLPNGQNKYEIADLVSKLSIHVRYPGDVQVIIPVPQKFYCNQDDLYILKDHYDTNGTPNWVYGGHSVTYENVIENTPVTLTVDYVTEADDDVTDSGFGYIKVTTHGITEDLIDALQEKYGDGINFEIYNYYNTGNFYKTGKYEEITYENLQKDYLNRSIVTFLDNPLPDFYINAFHEINKNSNGIGEINPGDCFVWIVGDDHISGTYEINDNQRSNFYNAYQGTHLNASRFNWIYTNKAVPGSVEPTGSDAMPAN